MTRPRKPGKAGRQSLAEQLREARSQAGHNLSLLGARKRSLDAAAKREAELRAEIDRLDGVVKAHEETNAGLKTTVQQSEAALEERRALLISTESQRQALSTNVDELTKLNDAQAPRISYLENRLVDTATRHTQEISEFRDDFESRLQQLAIELNDVRTELATERTTAAENVDRLETVCLILGRAHLAANNGTGRPQLATAVGFIEKAGSNDLVLISAALGFFFEAVSEHAANGSSLTPAEEVQEPTVSLEPTPA